MKPAYTLEDLIALAMPYDVDVMQVHESNQFRFNIIGKEVTIRVNLGDHESSTRGDLKKMHSYYAVRGVRGDFPHPTIRNVQVRSHVKRPNLTNHIEEVLIAATHIPRREIIHTMDLREKAFHKTTLYAHQNGQCHYCSKPLVIRDMTLDHMTPLSRGGADHVSNLCGACYPCNNDKGSMTAEEFTARRLNAIGV